MIGSWKVLRTEIRFTFVKDHAGSCGGKWLGEGRDGTGKVGDFCRNPGEGRQVMVTTRVVATEMNETRMALFAGGLNRTW